MPLIPQDIRTFLHQHHVVSLACQNEGEMWCASCFYAFDEQHNGLILLTDTTTQHGKLMLENNHIVGTIAGQPQTVREIEGIQFRATAQLLHNEKARQHALDLYLARHPIAKLRQSDVWAIHFTYIKHTSNRFLFAQKQIWQAH
ncbi:hypothetical protein A4G19_11210 [Pasteurellaceae bacterium Macca]|nr:hypothetical protein [Pasteurellaceae bacterium Macca]